MIIKNLEELLSHGDVDSRSLLLSIVDEVLSHENYENRILKTVKLSDNILYINERKFDLRNYRDIYVIAGGKYSTYMVKGLSDILGNLLKGGIVVDKKKYNFLDRRFIFFKAGHPIPNDASFRAGNMILN
ncbi:MAG: DUF4147 domain-containing protein, partial [Conexivisphaerales archaeon]